MLTKKILFANTKTPPQCAAKDGEAVLGKYHYVLALFLSSFIGNGYRTVSEPGRCAREPFVSTLLSWFWYSYCWVTALRIPAANVEPLCKHKPSLWLMHSTPREAEIWAH